MAIVGVRCRRVGALSVAVFAGLTCSDPAPPEPAVASIVLSVPDTGTSIRFRDPLVVRATPQAALGVPLARAVTWTSVTPSLLEVETLTSNGDSARIRATGVGAGEIRVSAAEVTRSFQVTVLDTVFSVSVTPVSSTGVSINGSPGACQFSFVSRSGQSQGRAYLLYVGPGAAITATMAALQVGSDTYLAVFDVTNPNVLSVLVASDDNSGGGAELRDARVQVNPASTGWFLEIRALFLAAPVFPNYNLVISP